MIVLAGCVTGGSEVADAEAVTAAGRWETRQAWAESARIKKLESKSVRDLKVIFSDRQSFEPPACYS
jgi:hypothetical protein